MANIQLEHVGLNFPIYGFGSRSLKKGLLEIVATGGMLKFTDSIITVEALKDINLSLCDGDRIALIGPNGSGKSTLLKVLAGIYEPQKGRIKVDGRVGSILDIPLGIDHEASGYENIKIRSMLLRLSRKQIQVLIPSIEEFTELGSFLKMPVRTYSSGMLIRLAFALSTMLVPDILLIDEVISVGDSTFMKKAQARLEKLVYRSRILIIASHSTQELRRFCNKALWLEHGIMKMYGPLDDIFFTYQESLKRVNTLIKI
ncbi:ABC transporter ATP-binding protein [Coxiella endosymbiont of Amblyomma nuttalli]|uniref:ABC transporter ATP-binding protein n=1 Tax=Coxiella endosymbiont of Amblyomma nuttalli TaxID=2749996 RepID=UPI001BAA7A29|nr:ABC transporter ATP-binding protein [Coxiella endosymbiont of Amblyomma nuttalli]QTS84143.1 Teichoic acids export ATP-binding protein TagH [Coxiella endosymbiont of Amblyomma nuttalli]